MRGRPLISAVVLLGCATPSARPSALPAAPSASVAAADTTPACVPRPRVVPRTGPLYFEYQVEKTVGVPATLQQPAPPPGLEGRSGRANLMFVVDTAGRVEPSTVTVNRATDARYGEAACIALRDARFAPARIGDRAVRMWYQMDFRF